MKILSLTPTIFILICIGIVGCQGSFVGQWTDTDEFGYGLSTYVCVNDNQFFGFYSQVGIMRGTVTGSVVVGNWYAVGSALYEEDEVFPSYGSFTLTLSDDDNSWSGSFTYAGTSYCCNLQA